MTLVINKLLVQYILSIYMLELSHLWSFRLVILIYFQMDDVTDFLRIFVDIQKLCQRGREVSELAKLLGFAYLAK